MELSRFIRANVLAISREWEEFARTCVPAAERMDSLALKDHIGQILEAIAVDLEQPQTADDALLKSRGLKAQTTVETAAQVHGTLRYRAGFDLVQLAAEYRALRASVQRLWADQIGELGGVHVADLLRFNEAVDEALAESIETFSQSVERSADIVFGVLMHEIKNPLSVLHTSAAVLARQRPDDEFVVHVADRVQRNAAAINRMVTALVEFVHLRLGAALQLQLESHDMGELCAQVIGDSQPWTHGRLKLQTRGDLRGTWDEHRTRQVLRNLFLNAIEHGEPAKEVSIELTGAPDAVLIEVTNSGAAIPEEIKQRIFEPFARFGDEVTPQTNVAHRGLGLYIVNEIVRAHGGLVQVHSAEGQTTFRVRLPRHPPGTAADSSH